MAGSAVLRALLWTLRPRTPSGRLPAPAQSVPPRAARAPSSPWRSCPVRQLQLSSALCAGHNKWSKVKNIKGPKDEARATMIMKYTLMLRIAVKEGGPNPDLNINLANIVEQCKSRNIPKASIEAAIKNAEKAKPASQHVFEARGPGGCLLLIEVLTDNYSRCVQDMKRLLIRNGAMLSDGARNNFNKRGVVLVPGQDISADRALELAIEVGAEDVQETENEEQHRILKFICDTADLRKVRGSLEEQGVQITFSGLEFIPRTLLPLVQNDLEAASTLIGFLNDSAEVVQVWDNIQVAEDT